MAGSEYMHCQANQVSQGRQALEERTYFGASSVLDDPEFGFRSRIYADEHCAARLNPTGSQEGPNGRSSLNYYSLDANITNATRPAAAATAPTRWLTLLYRPGELMVG